MLHFCHFGFKTTTRASLNDTDNDKVPLTDLSTRSCDLWKQYNKINYFGVLKYIISVKVVVFMVIKIVCLFCLFPNLCLSSGQFVFIKLTIVKIFYRRFLT